jgi:hypothetical protein
MPSNSTSPEVGWKLPFEVQLPAQRIVAGGVLTTVVVCQFRLPFASSRPFSESTTALPCSVQAPSTVHCWIASVPAPGACSSVPPMCALRIV